MQTYSIGVFDVHDAIPLSLHLHEGLLIISVAGEREREREEISLMMDKQSIMYRKSQIFRCENIFGQPGLCEN